MFARWLIRTLFLLPALACAVLWPLSHFLYPYAAYEGSSGFRGLGFVENGLYFVTGPGEGTGWHLGAEGGPDPSWWPDQGRPHFLGFSIDSEMGGYISYIRIPMWFPTTLSLALLLLIYRKTRPHKTASAFPVQPLKNPPQPTPTRPPSNPSN